MKETENDPLKNATEKLYIPKDFQFHIPQNSTLVYSFMHGEPCSFITDWQFPKLEKRDTDQPTC